jgi:hypothetical protein
MWAALRDESLDWILPGLDKVPANSVGLLVSNQRFIEAYMVGLNHEMARTLLWNGYPTDQRGTYFRQFWDSRATPGVEVRDIRPITDWQTAALGANSPRPTPPAIVLLVRADLIRRYPNTVVYAVRANEASNPAAAQTPPLFAGLLTRDVAFYGFPLSKDEVRTSPGYAFVLQEQPAEPRFTDPTPPGLPLPGPTFFDPRDVATTTAADFAKKTHTDPVRVVIPASLLVPPT